MCLTAHMWTDVGMHMNRAAYDAEKQVSTSKRKLVNKEKPQDTLVLDGVILA